MGRFGWLGPAATLGQRCPCLTQSRCTCFSHPSIQAPEEQAEAGRGSEAGRVAAAAPPAQRGLHGHRRGHARRAQPRHPPPLRRPDDGKRHRTGRAQGHSQEQVGWEINYIPIEVSLITHTASKIRMCIL